jgi:hypothetical protein
MPAKIFCCYAREDEALLDKLKTHLRPLQRQGMIDLWHDRDILAGSNWEKEIDRKLNQADIILLLVSSDFINSDYCYSKQMRQALERHTKKECVVIPIILRSVYWRESPLGRLQALPADGKPIIGPDWSDQDSAFYSVVAGIRQVLQGIAPRVAIKPLPITHNMPKPRVQGNQYNAEGNINIAGRDIHITEVKVEDSLTKGRKHAKKGQQALLRKEYTTAQSLLEEANVLLSEEHGPGELAQVKYYLALALLQGRLPFLTTLQNMRRIEELLDSAITLSPIHSYYYTLALFKIDFARHGLYKYKNDALRLKQKAQKVRKTQLDEENLQLLRKCQADLIKRIGNF